MIQATRRLLFRPFVGRLLLLPPFFIKCHRTPLELLLIRKRRWKCIRQPLNAALEYSSLNMTIAMLVCDNRSRRSRCIDPMYARREGEEGSKFNQSCRENLLLCYKSYTVKRQNSRWKTKLMPISRSSILIPINTVNWAKRENEDRIRTKSFSRNEEIFFVIWAQSVCWSTCPDYFQLGAYKSVWRLKPWNLKLNIDELRCWHYRISIRPDAVGRDKLITVVRKLSCSSGSPIFWLPQRDTHLVTIGRLHIFWWFPLQSAAVFWYRLLLNNRSTLVLHGILFFLHR